MVAFDDGTEALRVLDGNVVSSIHSNLTSAADITQAVALLENARIAFIGTQKGGPFDIPARVASEMLSAVGNPNGRPNSEVVVPWVNASDVTGRNRGKWIIDFGPTMAESEAAQYERPFEHVRQQVFPRRANLRRTNHRINWWRHAESRPGMRAAMSGLSRYAVTPRHSKHRVFTWEPIGVLPDSALVAFARANDYFFGVLQSRVHELWSRATGTQVREVESGFRYTPQSCFDTFPFPWRSGKEQSDDPRVQAIAVAAKELVEKRDAWLNPPGASAAELNKRTLTNLYNQQPQWLEDAHHALDKAVLAAYGWPEDLSDTEILERLLALNRERAGGCCPDP